jgi:molybdopterin molybdotransferase
VADLIGTAEARRRVLEAARRLPAEQVELAQALGRVLAEDVRSEMEVPPFDSSAMDGFAVVAGPEAELRVIGESRAGHPADVAVEPGTAVRISTGAAIPEGATAVVPVERTTEVTAGGAAASGGAAAVAGEAAQARAVRGPAIGAGEARVRVPATEPGQHVRRAGEDVASGAVVLRAGARLGPAEVGVAASVGRTALACARRPRLALLVTGDELAVPGEPLGPGRIYSSNGFVLAGLASEAGAELVARETVPDTAEGTAAAIGRALEAADVVVVSGGVSVGPHDHVKGALREHGVEERFWGVRLKPGKPVWFGVRDGAYVFGLPGNPVSASVTFALFARPLLAALQGADPEAERGTAILDEPVPPNPRREQAVRVHLRQADDGWHATPTGPQGSHVLTSMLGADALAMVPPGDDGAPAGARVEIELL